jgi:hypothetical protein
MGESLSYLKIDSQLLIHTSFGMIKAANHEEKNTTRGPIPEEAITSKPFSKAKVHFYSEVLKIISASRISYRVGGTYAVTAYTGIVRPTKDIDIFVRAGDYINILENFSGKGYKTSVPDERWLAKIKKGAHTCDLIFGLANAMAPVNDEWFKENQSAELFDMKVPILSPTELIWAKIIVQGRYKNDMHDIMHLIFVKYKAIDWKRLLSHMGQYWEMLLIVVLYFRFVYPSEREKIPRWLVDELLHRQQHQMQLPTLDKKICRGRLVSRLDYEIDIKEWGFKDLTA